MKKIYISAALCLALSSSIRAQSYQPGYAILNNGKRISGMIKLYKSSPWNNQRYIWFKDSAAYAANPNVRAKRYEASELKFYQVGSLRFDKVHYIDQGNIKIRNLYTNSEMMEEVSRGRITAYMFYSYPPEFFDAFSTDDENSGGVGERGDGMIKYRILFKKDGAKHFHNAYGYNLAKYFKDTPDILEKYKKGAYGNIADDADGSWFTKLSTRTIFTSQDETKGIIAAFNDYNIKNGGSALPTTDAKGALKAYAFSGTITNGLSHMPLPGVNVSLVDSLTKQTLQQTQTDSTGTYKFTLNNTNPFSVKIDKSGYVSQDIPVPTGAKMTGGALYNPDIQMQAVAAASVNGANGSANGNNLNADGTGSVKPYVFGGIINNGNSQLPLSGVTVSLTDPQTQQVLQQAVTDATGAYHFTLTSKNPFNIKVEKPNYVTQNVPVPDYSNVADGKLSNPIIHLNKGNNSGYASANNLNADGTGSVKPYAFSGIIKSGNSLIPLANVTINLIDPQSGQVLKQTTTDAKGVYHFTLSSKNPLSIEVAKPNYITQTIAVPAYDNVAAGKLINPVIHLQKGDNSSYTAANNLNANGTGSVKPYSFSGIIKSGNSLIPLANVTVNLIDPQSGQVLKQTTTDAKGVYHFTLSSKNPLSIEVAKPNYITQTIPVPAYDNVAAGKLINPVIHLQKGDNSSYAVANASSTGSNLSADGTGSVKPYVFSGIIKRGNTQIPLTNVAVNLVDVQTGQVLQQTTTDAKGVYKFTLSSKNPFSIEVAKPNYVTQTIPVPAYDNVSGGKLVSSVIHLHKGNNSSYASANGTNAIGANGSTSANGINAAAGVNCSAAGSNLNADGTASVKPFVYSGIIKKGSTQLPLTGATLSLIDVQTGQVAQQTVTDSRGVYKFILANKNAFTIRVEKEGYLPKDATVPAYANVSGGKLSSPVIHLHKGNATTGGVLANNAAAGASNSASSNGMNADGANGGSSAAGMSADGTGIIKPYVFSGVIRKGNTHKPVTGVVVSLIDVQTGQVVQQTVTDSRGVYKFILTNKNAFTIRVEKQGYLTQTVSVPAYAKVSGGKLFNPIIHLRKGHNDNSSSANGMAANAGSSANGANQSGATGNAGYEINKGVVSNILYDFGKATLRPESTAVLDKLVEMMNANPKMKVELGSHTDAIGSASYNLKLSQRRAQACVDYMISKGIDKDRITAKGYGKTKPIAPNFLANGKDNPAGRQLNRRTEFKVLNAE